MPGVALSVPGGRENIRVHVKLGVPLLFSEVNLDEVARAFPCSTKWRPGGLTFVLRAGQQLAAVSFRNKRCLRRNYRTGVNTLHGC